MLDSILLDLRKQTILTILRYAMRPVQVFPIVLVVTMTISTFHDMTGARLFILILDYSK